MFEILNLLISPLVALLNRMFLALEAHTGSSGTSVILLSVFVSLLLLPFQHWGRSIEDQIRLRTEIVTAKVDRLGKELKGEQRFRAIEQIYQQNGYHPIQSILLGMSFLVVLPVLIAALFLFTQTSLLDGKSFVFLSDLSKPDAFLGEVNILPFAMSAVTVVDANIRFRSEPRVKYQFYAIALVLLILVYSLPSGLILYWMTSNLVSLALSLKRL